MVKFSIDVTEESLAEYEKERLSRIKWFADNAPEGVKFNWVPPTLKEDGSLAPPSYEDNKAQMAENAKSPETWVGTRRGNSATATVVRKVD